MVPTAMKLFPVETGATSPVAVIDVGAYSARLRIVQCPVNEMEILEEVQQNLPLGNDVFRSGYISSSNITLAEEVFRDFGQLMHDYGVKRYKAVATSAVREALNSEIFLDRIELTSNIHLDILEGTNEARLLFLAVKEALSGRFSFNTGDSIIYTIGTGSSQVSLVEDGKLVHTDTIHLGTLRLAEEMDQQLTPSRLREAVDPLLAATFMGITRMSRGVHPENLIVVGAPVRAFISIVRKREKIKVATISRELFERHFSRLAQLDVLELVHQYDLADIDATGVLSCCHMLEQLFAISGAERMVVPMINTRDALTEDLFREISGAPDPFIEQIISSAEHLGQRYSYDRDHARKVADLALIIFDQMQDVHGLDKRARVLLEVAALLHDIGMFISNRQHHKHSFYLLRNSELPGISSAEQNLLSLVARYHRRATPESTHPEYVTLPIQSRVIISKLAAILRVADALDRAHQSKIKSLRVTCEQDRVILTARSNQDMTLAQWGLRMKGNMFEQVFGRRITLHSTGG